MLENSKIEVENVYSTKINKIKLKRRIKTGLIADKDFQMERRVAINPSFPWLVTIGNNVTLAPECMLLCHDGSSKKLIGYSKIGEITIGNNVFIGAKAIILPNTTIGNNVIVGDGSIITKSIPENCVVAGIPVKVVCSTEEYKNRVCNEMGNKPIYSM